MAETVDIPRNYFTSEVMNQPEIDAPLYSYDELEQSLCNWLVAQGLVPREIWFGRPTYFTDRDTGYFAWESGGDEEFPTHAMELPDSLVQKSNRPGGERASFCFVIASKPEAPFNLQTVLRFIDYPECSQVELAAALEAARARRATRQSSSNAQQR